MNIWSSDWQFNVHRNTWLTKTKTMLQRMAVEYKSADELNSHSDEIVEESNSSYFVSVSLKKSVLNDLLDAWTYDRICWILVGIVVVSRFSLARSISTAFYSCFNFSSLKSFVFFFTILKRCVLKITKWGLVLQLIVLDSCFLCLSFILRLSLKSDG